MGQQRNPKRELTWAEIITGYNNPYHTGDKARHIERVSPDDDLRYCPSCSQVFSVEADPYKKGYNKHTHNGFCAMVGTKFEMKNQDCPECDPGEWQWGRKRLQFKILEK